MLKIASNCLLILPEFSSASEKQKHSEKSNSAEVAVSTKLHRMRIVGKLGFFNYVKSSPYESTSQFSPTPSLKHSLPL